MFYLVCAHMSLLDGSLHSASLRPQEQRSLLSVCRAIIQTHALPTPPWGPRAQTLWHTAVSCSRSFSVLLSPHVHRGSIGFLGRTPKTTSFTPCPGSGLPFGDPTLSQVLCRWHRQSSEQGEGHRATWVSWFLACFDPKGRVMAGPYWDE